MRIHKFKIKMTFYKFQNKNKKCKIIFKNKMNLTFNLATFLKMSL